MDMHEIIIQELLLEASSSYFLRMSLASQRYCQILYVIVAFIMKLSPSGKYQRDYACRTIVEFSVQSVKSSLRRASATYSGITFTPLHSTMYTQRRLSLKI